MTWPFHREIWNFKRKESKAVPIGKCILFYVSASAYTWEVFEMVCNHLPLVVIVVVVLFNTRAMTFYGLTTVNGSIVTFLSASGLSKQNPEQVAAGLFVCLFFSALSLSSCICGTEITNHHLSSLTAQPKNLHVLVRTLKHTDSHTFKCFFFKKKYMYMSILRLNLSNGMDYGIIYKYDWLYS